MDLTYLIFFGIAFGVALALTPVVRLLGIRFGILDLPGKRKVHQDETPRLGGIAVFVATLAALFDFLVFRRFFGRRYQKSVGAFSGTDSWAV